MSDRLQGKTCIVTGAGDTLPSSVGQKPSGNGGKEDDYTPDPHGGRNH